MSQLSWGLLNCISQAWISIPLLAFASEKKPDPHYYFGWRCLSLMRPKHERLASSLWLFNVHCPLTNTCPRKNERKVADGEARLFHKTFHSRLFWNCQAGASFVLSSAIALYTCAQLFPGQWRPRRTLWPLSPKSPLNGHLWTRFSLSQSTNECLVL